MRSRIGAYITKKVSQEPYKCYVPAPLPPKPDIDLGVLSAGLEKAALRAPLLIGYIEADTVN
jgi:hypothetical protein